MMTSVVLRPRRLLCTFSVLYIMIIVIMIKQFNLERATLELPNPVPIHDDAMMTVRYRPIDEGTESSQSGVKLIEIRTNSQIQPIDKGTESSQSDVELGETRENAKILSSMGYNMTECSKQLDYKTLTAEAPQVDAWKTVVNEQLFVYSASWTKDTRITTSSRLLA